MYWKLAIQNIRRSLRDYIIYFVTLIFTALCDVLLFRDDSVMSFYLGMSCSIMRASACSLC